MTTKEGIIKNLKQTLAKPNLNPVVREALKKRMKEVESDKPLTKKKYGHS